MQTERMECSEENAERFWQWCQTRGGVARWRSINLSNPDASWSTPALGPDGKPTAKPTWQADSAPELVESDPAKITVLRAKEARRFHVAVRRGDSGLCWKLTDASTRKLRAAVDKLGDGAFYVFDYCTQEAVIMAPDGECTLAEWAARKAASASAPVAV